MTAPTDRHPLRPTVARLLHALWADRGHEVAATTLVERVWGDEPPRDPAGSLHQTIARLRRAMPDLVVTRTVGGYVLVAPAGIALDDVGPQPATRVPPNRLGPAVAARPFVGRDHVMNAAVRAAESGSGTVFHGIAGNGITRLAEEVIAELSRRGRRTAMLHCRISGSSMPLGAFGPLLPDAIPQQGVSMVVAAREAIVGSLDGEQLFLGVDELHALDASSAALVAQLVTSGAAVLIGTHRNMSFVHEPVAMLWHENFCRHVHVTSLDRAATRQLVETTLGHPVDEHAIDQIWSLTLGNPLFVTTVLEHDDLTSAASDQSVHRLVAEQLADLPADLRDALTVVALTEPIGASLVERLCDPAALVALERRLLIRLERTGRRMDIRMRHPLYGTHLRSSATRLMSRGIWNQMIDLLLDLDARRGEDLIRLTDWSARTGRDLPGPVALRAAEDALGHADAVVAEQLARSAWQTDHQPRSAAVLCEARYAWGTDDGIGDLIDAALVDADPTTAAWLHDIAHRFATWKVGGTEPAPLQDYEPIGDTLDLVARARLVDAEHLLRSFIDAQPRHRPDQVAVATATLGWLIGWRGRPVEGSGIAADAARSLSASGHRVLAKWAWMVAGYTAVVARATDVVDEALDELSRLTMPTTLDAWVDVIGAGRHSLRHDDDGARRVVLAAVERARVEGRWFDEAVALHDLVRIGGSVEPVIERLQQLSGVDCELVAVLADNAASLAHADEASVTATAERLAAAGLMGYAADAMALAAEMAARAGSQHRARDLRAQWAALADQCDMPMGAPPVLTVDPLTTRERQIAMLVGDGHASRTVAERLGLSVRTVDNHLAHVFTKLGITARGELRRALGLDERSADRVALPPTAHISR